MTNDLHPEPAPRLLIVSYHFPPAETVGARRPAALAAFAARQGWDVRVLTAVGANQGTVPVPVPEERLIRVAPSPRLPRPGRGGGGAVTGGGTASPSRLRRIRAGADRLLVKVGMELLLPDPQLNWIRPPARTFARAAAGGRPGGLQGGGPPLAGVGVGGPRAHSLEP